MKDPSQRQFLPRTTNHQSQVKTFKCANQHVFKSQNGVCPSCSSQGFPVRDEPGSFHKAFGVPEWYKK